MVCPSGPTHTSDFLSVTFALPVVASSAVLFPAFLAPFLVPLHAFFAPFSTLLCENEGVDNPRRAITAIPIIFFHIFSV